MLRVDRAFAPLAVAALIIAAIISVHLFIIAVVSCFGMVGCDMAGVLLTMSEARGQDVLAGYGDMGADLMGKYVLAGWSGSDLTHHGWLGWMCIIPILVTGFYTTKMVTRRLRKMKSYDA